MSRPLLQAPRLWVGEAADAQPRRATWLELFYDLVFVVAVSQLAHKLGGDVSPKGFLSFVALFIPVWWAWIGTTFYANRFDNDDLIRRVLMGLQMLAIAGLAVNVHHGLDSSSAGFALAYVASRLMLVLEYLWAGWHISKARGLTNRYAIGFGLGALLWLVSVFVPAPLRFILWSAGLTIDLITPLIAKTMLKQFPPHPEHLPERFGLFTIIVLGEAIIGVVNGVSEMSWNVMSSLSAIAGFVTAFSLWWIYFENVSGSALETAQTSGRIRILMLWLYIHLPLVIGLAATGVGVEHLIQAAGKGVLLDADRWLLCGSVALCYFSLAVLHRMGVIFQCKGRTRHRLIGLAAMLGLGLLGGNLTPLQLGSLVAAMGLGQISLDIYQGKPQGFIQNNQI
ncbi:low temperature requirement protein A [filamentous cyanobacterium LEGE 11480]|uniref:Low temperature requirement protein A n=1 Tax=Romeriopsis navalis LEGE 11480 TaxID=2777977 RepID=A0A928Z4Z5_9CYAN|nr:low temperature requirement protein A [Romeriopsis navalis]MBE9033136.1 low temperature requirement protein A [Romeriopsis navalis LEGE 11480]